jgi:hypothetical protein
MKEAKSWLLQNIAVEDSTVALHMRLTMKAPDSVQYGPEQLRAIRDALVHTGCNWARWPVNLIV